jgi:uncharacterized phage infection (PIP) family protein YhgE
MNIITNKLFEIENNSGINNACWEENMKSMQLIFVKIEGVQNQIFEHENRMKVIWNGTERKINDIRTNKEEQANKIDEEIYNIRTEMKTILETLNFKIEESKKSCSQIEMVISERDNIYNQLEEKLKKYMSLRKNVNNSLRNKLDQIKEGHGDVG